MMNVLDQFETAKIWIIAARPRTLVAGAVPFLVGTILGAAHSQGFDFLIAFHLLLTIVSLNIGMNLINDALDFKKGADTAERLGPLRVTQAGLLPYAKVRNGGFFCLLVTFLSGLNLAIYAGWAFFLLLIVSILLAYFYTGGPYPIAYYGLAEFFVFIFFGLIATFVSFYLQTFSVTFLPFITGAQTGLLSTLLIAIGNLRDYHCDKKAAKNTLAVRFGQHFARNEIYFCLIFPYIIGSFWLFYGFPLSFFLPLLTIPLSYQIAQKVATTEPSKEYNKLFAKAVLIQLIFGFGIIAGALS